jgi:hypothetical protein
MYLSLRVAAWAVAAAGPTAAALALPPAVMVWREGMPYAPGQIIARTRPQVPYRDYFLATCHGVGTDPFARALPTAASSSRCWSYLGARAPLESITVSANRDWRPANDAIVAQWQDVIDIDGAPRGEVMWAGFVHPTDPQQVQFGFGICAKAVCYSLSDWLYGDADYSKAMDLFRGQYPYKAFWDEAHGGPRADAGSWRD